MVALPKPRQRETLQGSSLTQLDGVAYTCSIGALPRDKAKDGPHKCAGCYEKVEEDHLIVACGIPEPAAQHTLAYTQKYTYMYIGHSRCGSKQNRRNTSQGIPTATPSCHY